MLESNLMEDLVVNLTLALGEYEVFEDQESTELTMQAFELMAEGIAQKLAEAVRQKGGELDEQQWIETVIEATRNAFLELPYGGPFLNPGRHPDFAEEVAFWTAVTVAPPGSEWAAKLEEWEKARLEELCASEHLSDAQRQLKLVQWAVWRSDYVQKHTLWRTADESATGN